MKTFKQNKKIITLNRLPDTKFKKTKEKLIRGRVKYKNPVLVLVLIFLSAGFSVLTLKINTFEK